MTHPDIDASDIEVSVTNGIVTLSGMTEDRRRNLGRAFIGIGAATTIPALLLLRRSIAPTNR